MNKTQRPAYNLGINHHLLFSEGMVDAKIHEQTLGELLAWPEFATVDVYCAGETAQQARESAMIRASGKTSIYNLPLLATLPGCDPNSTDPATITRTQAAVLPHLDAAAVAGSSFNNIASGLNPEPADCAQAWEGWLNFLAWFGNEVANRKMEVVIEPFDFSIGKNLLIGPTTDAIRSVEEMRARGIDNVFLMVDMGHLPIMGETFAHAITLSAPYLRHTHLGNAIIRDSTHPWYGDWHPPLGMPEGEHGVPELASFLAELLKVGYFNNPRASLTLEMRPYPGVTARASVDRWLRMMDEAWQIVEEGI